MFGLWGMEAYEDDETCPRSLSESGKLWEKSLGKYLPKPLVHPDFLCYSGIQTRLSFERTTAGNSKLCLNLEILLVPVVGPQLLVLYTAPDGNISLR